MTTLNISIAETHRKTAIIVGVLFIIATAFLFIGGAFYGPVLDSPDYLDFAYPQRITATIGMLIEFTCVLAIPLIAVFLNLLAVGAAYGILMLVFQEGYALENMLDFEATGIIEFWIPLFVFTVMFGISMDYLTFAIGRVQELHHRGWKTEDAILEGIRGSFGVVGSAAAIMIAVAVALLPVRFLAMKQMGFALALAVLFDATLVLLVLLPAMMRLAGDRLWYLPSWLNWIPGGPKPTPIPEPTPAPTPEPTPTTMPEEES